MVKETAWKWIDANQDLIVSISDEIWKYAEYGLCEEKSSKLLAETLKDFGFKVKLGVAKMPTAIYSEKGNGQPVIVTMGEYDALPGISNKAIPKKEPLIEGGMGHGCGHNIHGTTALAAAISVSQALEMNGVEGTIRFYGTPAEETAGGKGFMVNAGLFDDVDAALSHHPGYLNVASLQSNNITSGARFHFYGKSSHAAGNPEAGRSALDAIELMNIGVNYLREHILDDARIHYVIEEGGMQPNVVPDYARSWYYIRAPERELLEPIKRRVLKIAEGAALMTETKLKAEMSEGGYNKIPNKVLSEIVTSNMRQIGPPMYSKKELDFASKIAETFPKSDRTDWLRKRGVPAWEKYIDVDLINDIFEPWDDGTHSAGSSDVAHVSWVTPTMEFGTACNVNGAPGHSWQFVACSGSEIGHKSLIFASKTMAGSVIDLIANKELLKNAHTELHKRLRGREYKKNTSREPPLEKARELAKAFKGKNS